MRRREFIALLGGATAASAAWPLAASAQTPPKIPRVGYIASSSRTEASHRFEAFRQGLRELGYVEGQSIALEVRWAEGRMERIPELVAELVDLKMDVLVAGVSPAALAASKATRTIPIVMIAADPVGLGLVASLARPGGNITGVTDLTTELSAKRLEILQEVLPGLSDVAVLWNEANPGAARTWAETEAAGQKLGWRIRPMPVRGPRDVDTAFEAISADRPTAA